MEASQVWELDLFVADQTPKAKLTYDNLKRLFQESKTDCKIRVIDIYKNPEATVENEVMAIPTTIRKSPLPRVTLIGDLSDTARAKTKLGIK
ncbi:MAG TPA: circadian clock KaiB family protein [Verrucomicrobiae bacterium]|nr:circadian clock KaiB family protein [Verrucomicrobiae bacterium]